MDTKDSGFVAVSFTDTEANVYFVDQAYRDGLPVRALQPDRHIVHDRSVTTPARALERACFHQRVIHALAGAMAILVIGQADAASDFLRYVEDSDPGLKDRIVLAETLR